MYNFCSPSWPFTNIMFGSQWSIIPEFKRQVGDDDRDVMI